MSSTSASPPKEAPQVAATPAQPAAAAQQPADAKQNNNKQNSAAQGKNNNNKKGQQQHKKKKHWKPHPINNQQQGKEGNQNQQQQHQGHHQPRQHRHHHHGHHGHHSHHHSNQPPVFPPSPPIDEQKEQALDSFFYNHSYRQRVIKNKYAKKEVISAAMQKFIADFKENPATAVYVEKTNDKEKSSPSTPNQQQSSSQQQEPKQETEAEKKARTELFQTILTGEQFQLPEKYEIICTDNAYQVDWWIATNILRPVASAPEKVVIVGMDCEWDMLRPNLDINVIAESNKKFGEGANSYQGYSYSSFPDTIQIATENSCLIYQCGAMPPSAQFIMMLLNNRVLKVWCNHDQDVEKLDVWFANFNALNFKLASCAQALGFCDVDSLHLGAYQLCAKVLQKRLEKDWSIIFSRWSRRKLDDKQQLYAAIDAYLNYCIFKKK